MTNKEIIKKINSTYQLPTDEQIFQVLKVFLGTSYEKEKIESSVSFVKEHYYD